MRAIRQEEAERLLLEGIGHSGRQVESTEVLASLLRVSAGFHRKCPGSSLVLDVLSALDGLACDVSRERLEPVLDSLLAYGDLVEYESVDSESGNRRRLLYARPPSFVAQSEDHALLLGIAEMDRLPLSAHLQSKLEYVGHIRRIADVGVSAYLKESGFLEITQMAWCRGPKVESYESHIARFNELLDQSTPVRDVSGLRVVDPSKPVTFYRGRWTNGPIFLSGRFVGRRARAYGNDLWCYVLLDNGKPVRLIDLVEHDEGRPCDAAWRLQSAIDASLGSPQILTSQPSTGDGSRTVLSVYSPLPQWVQRRWDTLGTPASVPGALISGEMSTRDAQQEAEFLVETLWMRVSDTPGS